ncbi:MAG TPA: DUF4440 domain-containing protein [Vicinamibacterales bacterium]|nr:DUF4440 domain-containing protein [Vicinamibacterales bacterium]
MTRIVDVVVSVALAVVLTGAVQAQTSPRTPVEAAYAVMAAGIKARDAARIASIYGADAIFTKPGDRVRTREGIARMWQEQLDKGITEFLPTIGDVDLKDDVITETGTWVMKGPGGKVIGSGTYANRWQRQGGAWKLVENAVK